MERDCSAPISSCKLVFAFWTDGRGVGEAEQVYTPGSRWRFTFIYFLLYLPPWCINPLKKFRGVRDGRGTLRLTVGARH